ncbi:MAG: HAD family hydrolase [Steroidobacteraceae bacterium]
MRALARDAGRDRRRHLAARSARHPGDAFQRGRGSRAGRHGAARQDRHAHRGCGPRHRDAHCADLGQSRALAIAAALETSSRHPVAEAFRSHARAEIACSDAREIAGSGIEGTIDGETWRIGTAAFAGALAAEPAAALARLAATQDGASIVLGNASGPQAAFVVSDELRADSRATVEALRAQGLELQLASGDQPGPVAHVAHELGIATFHARLRPEEKLRILRERQAAGRRCS